MGDWVPFKIHKRKWSEPAEQDVVQDRSFFQKHKYLSGYKGYFAPSYKKGEKLFYFFDFVFFDLLALIIYLSLTVQQVMDGALELLMLQDITRWSVSVDK